MNFEKSLILPISSLEKREVLETSLSENFIVSSPIFSPLIITGMTGFLYFIKISISSIKAVVPVFKKSISYYYCGNFGSPFKNSPGDIR